MNDNEWDLNETQDKQTVAVTGGTQNVGER